MSHIPLSVIIGAIFTSLTGDHYIQLLDQVRRLIVDLGNGTITVSTGFARFLQYVSSGARRIRAADADTAEENVNTVRLRNRQLELRNQELELELGRRRAELASVSNNNQPPPPPDNSSAHIVQSQPQRGRRIESINDPATTPSRALVLETPVTTRRRITVEEPATESRIVEGVIRRRRGEDDEETSKAKKGTPKRPRGGNILDLLILKKLKPISQQTMRTYGDDEIISIKLCRHKINAVANEILTRGNILPYDILYHLMSIVTVNHNGEPVEVVYEKQTFVNIVTGYVIDKATTEVLELQPPYALKTLNEIFSNMMQFMGPNKMFVYDGYKNNCQVFIASMLKCLNITDAYIREWVLQDKIQTHRVPAILRLVTKILTTGHSVVSRGGDNGI